MHTDAQHDLVQHKLSGALSIVLGLLVFTAFLNYIDRSNLSIAAPMLKDELRLSDSQLGLLLSAFYWSYGMSQILAGWLVDRFHVNWVLAAGFFLWSAATGITGILHGFVALFVVRLVLGIGESVAYPAYSRILAQHFPLSHKSRANALIAAGLSTGPAFGMLAGGVLMSRFGWRPFFMVLGAASLLWLVPWFRWSPMRSSRYGRGLFALVALDAAASDGSSAKRLVMAACRCLASASMDSRTAVARLPSSLSDRLACKWASMAWPISAAIDAVR
jgi:MFS family permease